MQMQVLSCNTVISFRPDNDVTIRYVEYMLLQYDIFIKVSLLYIHDIYVMYIQIYNAKDMHKTAQFMSYERLVNSKMVIKLK